MVAMLNARMTPPRVTTQRVARYTVALLLAANCLSAQTPFEQGRRLFDDGRFADASLALTPIAATDMRAAILLGRVALHDKRLDDAVKWFGNAVKLRGDTVATHLWLGRAYVRQIPGANFLSQPGLAFHAKAQFDKAVELEPKNVEVREDRAIFYMYSPAIIGGGIEKARAEAEVARTLDAYRGGLLRAQIEAHEKNNVAVEREYAALVKNYPDSVGPFDGLIGVYQTASRFSEAFATIDARLATVPKDAEAQYQLGKTASMSGQQLKRGEAALRTYLAMPHSPALTSDAWAHYRIGLIREQQQDAKGARAEYETALQLDTHLTDADRALKRLPGGP